MNSERSGFDWLGFLIRAIIITLFILLLIWIFPIPSAKDYENINNKLNIVTDRIFNENILNIKDAAKDYYTIERLPSKVGEKVTLTLKEMLDLKLLLPFKDSKGKSCNTNNSYVEVTKLDNEYLMKINLNCDDAEDYILVHMGCYDYCKTTICEQEKPEIKQTMYQYKKGTSGYWSNYGSWNEWSKTEVSATNERQIETKQEEETYTETVTDTQQITTSPECPKGYTQDGFTCSKKSSSSWTYVKTVSGARSVPSDTSKYKYTVVSSKYAYECNDSCSFRWYYTYKVYKKTTSIKTTTAICPSGYEKGSNSCYKDVTTTKEVTKTRMITLYRYRTRTWINGNESIKWSYSINDTSLLNQGYRYTGVTKYV